MFSDQNNKTKNTLDSEGGWILKRIPRCNICPGSTDEKKPLGTFRAMFILMCAVPVK